MIFIRVLAAALFPIATLAANDWTQPCHNGECQWDLSSGHGSGTMRLTGSLSAISDLTTAGGWTILDCDGTSADGEIRLVCHDPSKCDHLYLNGAEHTLVRLPDDCSTEPFAFVTRVWDHDDQSIPASKRSLLGRRGGPQSAVRGITLSTDFSQRNIDQHGDITISLVGSSTNGVISRRQDGKSDPASLSGIEILPLKLLAGHNETGNFTLPDKTVHLNLFNDSLSCPQSGVVPAFDGAISVDLDTNVTGAMSYVVGVAGNLSALDSSAISLSVSFNTTIDGTLRIDADIMGSLSTGDITVFTIGLPGLDFGSAFKLGPTFNVYAEADASIEANLELDVDLLYTISDGQLIYPSPHSQGSGSGSGGSFSPGDSNIKLSASPNVTAQAKLSAHLKPTLEFGITLLGSDSGIYLNLDAFAELDLSLGAGAAASTSTSTDDNSAANSTGTGGCIDILTGLSVNAGATADLFDILDVDDTVTLYNMSFDLFKKCFGNGYQRRDYSPRAGGRVPLSFFERNLRKDHRRGAQSQLPALAALAAATPSPVKSSKGFSCPEGLLGSAAPIVSQIVKATSLQEHKN